MWRLLFLVVVVAAAASCVTKSDLVQCAYRHIDSNDDMQITVAELDNFLMENTCGVQEEHATGQSIMTFCDFNGDGVLTAAADVDPAAAPCLYSEPLRRTICGMCDKCDANTV